MTDFYTLLDEWLGASDAISDIRVVVRRLWFYDFIDHPVRLWQGQGTLHTTDGNEWLGTVDINGTDHHETSALQDGRDGSSATYTFAIKIPDLPGEPAHNFFDGLKQEQWKAKNRPLTCYLAIFNEDDALRPLTPIIYFKELTLIEPRFSEKIDSNDGKKLVRTYKVSMTAKDSNFGRSNRPNGTYADTIQKRRANELGVSLDRGCEFLSALANKTFQIP
jgi:hypothetical protein